MLVNTTGNSAIVPLTNGPTQRDSVTTVATNVATIAARNGMSYQRRVISGIFTCWKRLECSGMQIAKAMALATRPPSERPRHHAFERGQCNPDRDRAADADHRILALRQHHIGQTEEHGDGVDRKTRQRALGDERRIVIERQKNVRRARRNRQRRDQRTDHRRRSAR